MGMDEKSRSEQIWFSPDLKRTEYTWSPSWVLHMYFIWFQSCLWGWWSKLGAEEGWVCKLWAKYSPEHPGIWHQFALKISVVVGLQWKEKSNWIPFGRSLHLCGRLKGASQHWVIMIPDQEMTNRISSLGWSGTSSTCRFCETKDNQQGIERSPVSVVYSWSAPDLQWYLTQCSVAFKKKQGLFTVFVSVFILKIRSGSSLQVSVSGSTVCSVCFVASLGTQMLLLWEQNQSVRAVP